MKILYYWKTFLPFEFARTGHPTIEFEGTVSVFWVCIVASGSVWTINLKKKSYRNILIYCRQWYSSLFLTLIWTRPHMLLVKNLPHSNKRKLHL